MTVAAALILSLVAAQERQVQVIKIPGTLVEVRMVRIPDGEIRTEGKTVPVKGLWVSDTEVAWDVYDIWTFRLDLTEEQKAAGVEAKSRPSKPYGSPDRGFGHAGYPMLGPTFYAALEFCDWLSAKTGKKFRLPSEAEWEYFARAGSAQDPADVEAGAWVWENSDDKTQPVGKKPANAFGLFDTLGNVAEWARGLDNKPVVCGGSWRDKKASVGFATRAHQTTAWNRTDPQNPKSKWWLSDGDFVGFRIVSSDAP
ncbi:MAG TPA: SUMF1/EgtB/PvdO family nonheme iron enzyme [Fimbriimonas sp.]